MGFSVMSMTDAAAARVKAIVENSGPDAKGVRVGIKKGGCAGMEYTIDLVTEPNPKDDLIERDGVMFSLRGGPRQPKPTDRAWDPVAVYANDELTEEEFQELYETNRPDVPELNLHY